MPIAKLWNGTGWEAVTGRQGDQGPVGLKGATGGVGPRGIAGEQSAAFAAARETGILMQVYDIGQSDNGSGDAMVNGAINFSLMYLPRPETLTGMIVPLGAQGVFTPSGDNKVGLYATDGSTLTLVAESANNSGIWTAAAASATAIPFTTPYAAQPGYYYAAALWSASAVTTAPTMPTKRTSASLKNYRESARVSNYFWVGQRNTAGVFEASIPATNVTITGGSVGMYQFWGGCY